MNKIIKGAIYCSLVFFVVGLRAQTPCPSANIQTKPQDLGPYNPQSPPDYRINQFDWQQGTFYINSPNYNPISTFVGSPFYQNNTQLSYLNAGLNSDFQWEDGWEIIQRGLGYLMGGDPQNPPSNGTNGFPDNSQNLIAPYLILYNKFEAKLRVFGAIGSSQLGYNSVTIKLSFQNQNAVSALLSNHSAIAQVMSEETTSVEVKAIASYPGDKLLFFHSDFPLAYDPCTCEFASDLVVSFGLVDNMDVDLYGRFTGLTTELGSGGGNNASLNADFLSTVQSDVFNGSNIVAGAVTYKRIGDLESQLQAVASAQGTDPGVNWKNVIEILKFGASLAGIKAPDLEFDNKKLEEYFKKDGQFSKDLKAVSLFADFFSARVKSSSTDGTTSKPTMIEGEAIFTGTIIDNDSYGWGAQFATPGSKNSNVANSNRYPLYNEALGLFAVLNKPEVKHAEITSPTTVLCTGTYPPNNSSPGPLSTVNITHQYRFENLEYIYNPAAEINSTNTQILGSLEFHTNSVQDLNSPKNMYKLRDSIYMSPTFPIECLSEFVAEYTAVPSLYQGCCDFNCLYYRPIITDVYLKLIVIYEFNRNGSNGVPNRSVQMFKYPVELTSGAPSTFVSYPLEREIQSTNFNTNTTLYSWETTTITGDLTAAAGVEVNIFAGGGIIVEPGVEIGPGINLQTASLIACNNPISQTALGTFCTDGRYKGNTASKTVRNPEDDENLVDHQNKKINLFSYPNPFDSSTTLEYNLPSETKISIVLVDINGRIVETILNDQNQNKGKHKVQISGLSLSQGIYSVILKTSSGTSSLRLIKTN